MSLFVYDSLNLVILILFQIIKSTWWIILPTILVLQLLPLWLYVRQVEYKDKWKWILLEITLPPDVLKTPKAMENVLAGLHGAWRPIKPRKKWIEGRLQDQFSLELVGTNGELHFYVRCQKDQRNFVEARLYSQYPDLAINEVSDYVEDLPTDIPGRDYELYGGSMVLEKDWAYPIATYIDFEDPKEERRLDPLSNIAETVAFMQPGEHLWLQIIISTILPGPIEEHAIKIRDKYVGRRPQPESLGIGREVFDFTADVGRAIAGFELSARPAEDAVDLKELNLMQRLTRGEQEVAYKVEMKPQKVAFETNIHVMYLARKDIFRREHVASFQGFFRQLTGVNRFRFQKGTYPSNSIIFFKEQRNYIRKRKLYWAYKLRYFNWLAPVFVLNVEELATIFHFPGQIVTAPLLPRLPSRRAEPPRDLPS